MPLSKPKILVADDEPDFVKVLRDLLEYEGYETLASHEGVRTIEMVHKHKPDLVLLDLQMPAGTGQTVLKALRSSPETKSIPIIVMTGWGNPKIEKESRAAGAQDFVQKPYEPVLLLKKIRDLLSP